MEEVNIIEIQNKMSTIVKDYLFSVSSLGKHDYFNKKEVECNRTKYFNSTGFQVCSSFGDNGYVVREEKFLEGCTRVFLINPIFKMLMDVYGINNDWQYGNTFGKYTISTREYEMSSYVEFIAELNGENVGVRYTKASYSTEEVMIMNRDYQYLYQKESIPGFKKISKIDKLYALDWSGISELELEKIHLRDPNGRKLTEDMTVKKFFLSFFSKETYELFLQISKKAMSDAKDIIGLRVIPQLLPNNMLNFKQAILEKIDEYSMDVIRYDFEDNSFEENMSKEDINIIKKSFYEDGLRESLIGNSDFAKSFITSEYLYMTMQRRLSIDYTVIVVGYLKSIEQLLYLLYVSAFKGNEGMFYWDTCKGKKNFDDKLPNYRQNPYDVPDKEKKQEKYYHKKKNRKYAPEIGELTRFLRYYHEMWRISEDGKEYVFKCLEDFRRSCRNSNFHKDNIEPSQYSQVVRIRNNTLVCLYYLLGGFELLDDSIEKNEQLGIIDYRFECLYNDIRQRRIRFFEVCYEGTSKYVICYLNDDSDANYYETGELKNTQLKFLRTSYQKEDVNIKELNELMNNAEYVKENTIIITRDTMPNKVEAFLPQKE